MLSPIPALLRRVAVHRATSLTLLRGHLHRPVGGYAAAASFHATSRFAASASEPSGEVPILKKIRENPKVTQQFAEFIMLLEKKGINTQGKPPAFHEMMQLMKDPEMKGSVQKLMEVMHAAGIRIDMEALAAFQKAVDKKLDDGQEDSSLKNKLKNLFKKD